MQSARNADVVDETPLALAAAAGLRDAETSDPIAPIAPAGAAAPGAAHLEMAFCALAMTSFGVA